ncbi:hypothetical protein [Nocardioides sp. TF02-7]|uniref:hypothetical protein n=1 Tax=Nocardioides sp. TF02-7 TaxID=2917724 RepID=UPI001F063E09|nr:hypothetical protein [Nocardioides sp. TF02-7]UMG94038.1 hypothetical protein MF408_08255 [Nocardioides sp. TF02-7]
MVGLVTAGSPQPGVDHRHPYALARALVARGRRQRAGRAGLLRLGGGTELAGGRDVEDVVGSGEARTERVVAVELVERREDVVAAVQPGRQAHEHQALGRLRHPLDLAVVVLPLLQELLEPFVVGSVANEQVPGAVEEVDSRVVLVRATVRRGDSDALLAERLPDDADLHPEPLALDLLRPAVLRRLHVRSRRCGATDVPLRRSSRPGQPAGQADKQLAEPVERGGRSRRIGHGVLLRRSRSGAGGRNSQAALT